MITIVTGYVIDLIIGDPYWMPHPIRWIGLGISNTEKILRKFSNTKDDEKKLGIFLPLIVVGITYLITWGMIQGAKVLHPYIGYGVEGFLIFQILATKSLDKESKKVFIPLKQGNILNARKYLSYIVGRDTRKLDKNQVTRAVVETIAENISDGIIAPLFYIVIGGPALGMAYKAINTLDSMVGYKNERYQYFGWASAKLDDVANYIPARLTAIFIVIAAYIKGFDWKNSIKIIKRDRKNHKSPNSGYPESAVAGALRIQIGGTNTYFGQLVYKPTIGDPIRALEIEDIIRTIHIMYITSGVGVMILGGIKLLWN